MAVGWIPAALSSVPSALGSEPEVGEIAPDIELKALLNAPQNAEVSWHALRGKVVVLDFWSTKCTPCISAIPYLNKLEAAFAEEQVVFLHVADDDAKTVERFLQHTPIRGWMGIDDDRATMKNFGVRGWPAVAVVGRHGRFLGWTHPMTLSSDPSILRQIVERGISTGLSTSRQATGDGVGSLTSEERCEPDDLCHIVIRPAHNETSKQLSSRTQHGFDHVNKTLLEEISLLWNVPQGQIVPKCALPQDRFDILALGCNGMTPKFNAAIRELIESTFGVSVTHGRQRMPVYLLRVAPGKAPVLTPATGLVYTDPSTGLSAPSKAQLDRLKDGETCFFAMCPLGLLPGAISAVVERPVQLDLGELTESADGNYQFFFPYDPSAPEGFKKALEEKVGFTLAPAEREVEVLLVSCNGSTPSSE